jgi:hypothetical protein
MNNDYLKDANPAAVTTALYLSAAALQIKKAEMGKKEMIECVDRIWNHMFESGIYFSMEEIEEDIDKGFTAVAKFIEANELE